MGFFDLFKAKEEREFINDLHRKFSEHFPKMDENRVTALTCISGLLAKVAYVDFQVHPDEVENMKKALIHWSKLTEEEAQFVAEIAVTEIKSLSSHDNRKYCKPLVEIFSVDERFEVLETLFELAASDGIVELAESNEINYISKALVLEHKYFVAAKAQVREFLATLK